MGFSKKVGLNEFLKLIEILLFPTQSGKTFHIFEALSLRTADAFPVVEGREATTGNASALTQAVEHLR